MLRTILVPLDGSRFAERALPLATWLASKARARLHLLLAHQPAVAIAGLGDYLAPPPEFDDALRDREQTYLFEARERLGVVGDGPVDVSFAEAPAGPEIVETSVKLGADLIVMATHGRGAIGRLWLGSVADYVVRHSAAPVMLVRGEQNDGPPGAPSIRGILVPLDLSAESRSVLEPVISLAQVAQAHVTLLHVVEEFFQTFQPGVLYPTAEDPVIAEIRRTDAQRVLDRIADRLRERGLAVSVRVVADLSAASGILRALEEDRFGLVAMTTQGASGIRRFVLGSVADKVVRGAEKPVLVLRPSVKPEE